MVDGGRHYGQDLGTIFCVAAGHGFAFVGLVYRYEFLGRVLFVGPLTLAVMIVAFSNTFTL